MAGSHAATLPRSSRGPVTDSLLRVPEAGDHLAMGRRPTCQRQDLGVYNLSTTPLCVKMGVKWG